MPARIGFASALAERCDPQPHPYASNPVGWVHDRLKEPTWSGQDEILLSVLANRKTLAVSCNGIGKDWTAARAAGWWLATHPPEHTLVATTAPTGDQVKGIIWQELVTVKAGGNSREPLPGQLNQTEWWIGTRQVGIGRKTADHAAAAGLGFHARYLLVIVDEMQGVAPSIIDDLGRLLTADDVPGYSMQRVLGIANPDYEGSKLHRLCAEDSDWNVIQTEYDQTPNSPNYTGEPVAIEVSSQLIGPTFVESRRKEFGEDSPQFIASVLGKFPKDAAHGVVPLSWLRQCQEKHNASIASRVGPLRLPVELGVDVGGSETGDWTVIAGREGPYAMPYRSDWHLRVASLETERIVQMILGAIEETRATSVKVDEGGVGYGVCGHLRSRLDERHRRAIDWPVAVLPVNAGEASMMVDARDRPRFANVKAEMWWEVGRGMVRPPGLVDVSALDEIEVAQLTDVRYTTDKAGRVVIESKAEVKKRTGRSPDDADARLLSFFTPRALDSQMLDDLPSTYTDARGRR